MEGSWLALLPFIIVIVVALFTKQIVPALFAALLVGGYLLEPTLFGGIRRMVGYIVVNTMEQNNIRILIYLFTFAGFINLIRTAGGIKGIVNLVSRKVQSRRNAILLTWLSTIVTFSAPSFRIITMSPVLKALGKRLKISDKRTGFIIEVTSNPVVALIPIATAFVGYMVSIIDISAKQSNLQVNAYATFVRSIPFNFYSIVLILIGIYYSFFKTDEEDVIKKDTTEELDVLTECQPAYTKEIPCKPMNFILPILIVIGVTLFLSWWDGRKMASTFFDAFLFSDALMVMLVGLFFGLITTIILFYIQKIAITKQVKQFLEGGNEMMTVLVMLILIWGITAASEDLGFTKYIGGLVQGFIPQYLIAPAVFLFGGILSYFIGSSWGTWGLLMPLAISLGVEADANILVIVGAVFASGIFGAFTSPLSDNTASLCTIMDMPIIEYAHTKLAPSIIAAVISLVLFTAAALFIS